MGLDQGRQSLQRGLDLDTYCHEDLMDRKRDKGEEPPTRGAICDEVHADKREEALSERQQQLRDELIEAIALLEAPEAIICQLGYDQASRPIEYGTEANGKGRAYGLQHMHEADA